jgi:hypothetical protein
MWGCRGGNGCIRHFPISVELMRNRAAAIRWHADWLLKKKGTGTCPYQHQAAEYVRVAADFKQKFASQTVEAAQRVDGGMSTV